MLWNRKGQRQTGHREPEDTLAGAPEAPPASTQATAVLAAEATAAEENEVPAFDEEELAVLGAQAIGGLHEVIDPELGVNIVDLGLVYGIAFGRGEIIVTMTLTTPGCPLHASLQRAAEQALHEVLPAFPAVTINLVWSPRWHTGLITPEGRRELGWEW
jgi:metal-sulfur cluster biosynthetic enzyme